MKILVNGEEVMTVQDEISFEDVVFLAFDPPPSKSESFTVTYQAGTVQGTVEPGSRIPVVEGMVFEVVGAESLSVT